MYGLPSDFDPHVFEERILDAICFTENSVSLIFGKDLGIDVATRVTMRLGQTGDLRTLEIPVRETDLMTLVGNSVSRALCDRSGHLELHFQDGSLLSLNDDSPQYECYTVRLPGREIFV